MLWQKKNTPSHRSFWVKRAAIAAIAIAAAAAFGLTFEWMSGPDSSVWTRVVYATVVCGLGMGGLLQIIEGWIAFIEAAFFIGWMGACYALPGVWSALAFFALWPVGRLWRKLRFPDAADPHETAPRDVLGEDARSLGIWKFNPRRARALVRLLTGLMYLGGAVQILWLFADVPYAPFAALSLLPTPIVLLLYLLFPNELTASDKQEDADGRVSIIGKLLGLSFAPMLRLLLDFNFLRWTQLCKITGILFLVLMAAVLILSREWRKRPALLLGIAFALILYLPALTGQVNVLMDSADPEIVPAAIVNMEAHHNTRAPDRYTLILDVVGGEVMELSVSKDQYDAASIGDYVNVYIWPGRLDIPYAEAYSPNWE